MRSTCSLSRREPIGPRRRIVEQRAVPDREERRWLAPPPVSGERRERRRRDRGGVVASPEETQRRHRRALVVRPRRAIDPTAIDAIGDQAVGAEERRDEPIDDPRGERAVVRPVDEQREPCRRRGAARVAGAAALDPTDPAGRILAGAHESEHHGGALAMRRRTGGGCQPEGREPEPRVVVEVPAAGAPRRRVPGAATVPLEEVRQLRDRRAHAGVGRVAGRPQHVHERPERRRSIAPSIFAHDEAPSCPPEGRPFERRPHVRRRRAISHGDTVRSVAHVGRTGGLRFARVGGIA